jgi:hypothetical protein
MMNQTYVNASTDRYTEHVINIGRVRLMLGDLVAGAEGFVVGYRKGVTRSHLFTVAAFGYWLTLTIAKKGR